MASLLTRKLVRRVGLLKPVRTLKKKFIPVENAFKPADPRLLISVTICMRWLIEKRVTEGSDYLEFGIYRGFNFWYTQALAKVMGVEDMRFFGFDSFFGLPPITVEDKGGPFHEGDFSAYRDEVEVFLDRYGVDWTKTFLVEGFFEKTLNPGTMKRHRLRQCSLCVVDCDLYSSSAAVLRFIEPLIGDQSILLFDDWHDFGLDASKGEQRAFAEFSRRNEGVLAAESFVDLIALGGKGKAFVLRRESPRASSDSFLKPVRPILPCK